MKKKELIKHYNIILNFPSLEIHPERKNELKAEIQRLADIDKISYQLALVKVSDNFFNQYEETGPDDEHLKKIETATENLFFLKKMEGLDVTKNLFN